MNQPEEGRRGHPEGAIEGGVGNLEGREDAIEGGEVRIRRRSQVMIAMDNEPGFEQSAVHLGQRDARWHRINPEPPAGLRDGEQGSNLVVHRHRTPEGSSENDSSEEERRIQERERRKDEERRSPRPNFLRKFLLVVAGVGYIVFGVVLPALHLGCGYRVNETLQKCYDPIGNNSAAQCLKEV